MLLTQDIDDNCFAKKKAGIVFVNLTAAYDTVLYCGLICKLLQLLPDRHMVHLIMEMVGKCRFTLTTGNGKQQATMLRKQHPTGILSGTLSLRHLHL